MSGIASMIAQIMILDIVFSLDSVITAVGMADEIIVMIAALAGVAAAVLPARRAAKLNILDAIADD